MMNQPIRARFTFRNDNVARLPCTCAISQVTVSVPIIESMGKRSLGESMGAVGVMKGGGVIIMQIQ